MRKFLPLLTCLIISINPTFGIIKTWVGINTNWNDANNWSPLGVPVKNDSVFINAGAANYPALAGSLEVMKHSASGTSTTTYTCQYLYLASGAQINSDNNAHSILFAGDGNVSGTINLPGGTITCEVNEEVFAESFHILFSGATITCSSYESGLDICGNPGIDSYTNCYIEGGISLNEASFSNCTLAGSVLFNNTHHPNLNNCTIRLMEKYGGYVRRGLDLGSCFFPAISSFSANIVNNTVDDDTLQIFTSPFPGAGIAIRDFYGNININTNNECARITIGTTLYSYPYQPCPVNFVHDDSMTIHGNVTIQNKGILEFAGPYEITGTTTLNHGHLIKTYPCAVNSFPPGDTINCPINFGRATLDLSGGKLVLNSNIVADSLRNYSATNYLVTSASGSITRSVQNIGGNLVFPIGTSTSYNPVVMSDTSLTPIRYSAAVSQGVYSNGNGGSLYTTNAVDRTWNISKLINTNSSATVTLQWNSADELPGFTRSLCAVSHYSSNAWHNGPYSIASGSNPYQQSWSGLNSFSPFAIGSTGLLPLGCIKFTGSQKQDGIVLNWTTGPGNDHYTFIIQRSNDGQSFSDIYTMNAGVVGAGSSFSYTDKDFKSTDNFYRIYEIDSRGIRMQICNTIHVAVVIKQLLITLLGNPVSNEVGLRINAESDQALSIVMYDMQGRPMLSNVVKVKKGLNYFNIHIDRLAPGIYMMKIPGTGYVEKLFINKH